jgi:predicted transposase YbfD/YdcC
MSSLLSEPAGQGDAAGAGADQDDLAELMPVRLDGKTVRGTRDAAGNQRHLLSALAGRTAQCSVVAAQAEVGVKTNEVPMATAVLGQIDLKDKVVTADALHTVKAAAEFICEGGGEFALPVKENRKALFDALDALPWHQVPVAHSATDRGHGRITTRTIQVLPAPGDLPFPHVSQAYLIERHVTGLDGKPLSDVAALGVTSLTAARAHPARLAGLVRGRAQEPRHRRPPPGRAARHHRSHPLGQPVHGPALYHPRTHIMALKRSCWLGSDAHGRCLPY